MKLYTEDELDSIVRAGCASSGGTRNAICLTSATIWKPINKGTVDLWRSRLFTAMDRIDGDLSVAYAHDHAAGVTIKFDITTFRI